MERSRVLRGEAIYAKHRVRQRLLRGLPGPHFPRMPLAVKEDVAPNPLPVRLLRAPGVMFEAHDLAHLLPQTQLGIGHQALARCRVWPSNIHTVFLPKGLLTKMKARNRIAS